MEVVMGMVFDLIPIVIAWGTIALVIATYTPVFNWISYPMGLYMKLFGVKEAFAAATASGKFMPRAKWAAMAEERVQPVPCVLREAMRLPG